MTTRSWRTREEWRADAEKFVRQACYPSQRVPEEVTAWADDDERAQVAQIAREARLGAARVARLLEKDGARLADIERELFDVHRLLRAWGSVQTRAAEAAEQAVDAAVAAEVTRRSTDAAWAQELNWRHGIDREWVLPVRPA